MEGELTPYPKVSPQQHQFVLAYLLNFNIKEASEAVGITPGTGGKWLELEPIQEMMRQKARDLEKVADITIEECVSILAKIARFDHKEYLKDFKKDGVTLKDFENIDSSVISSMNVKFNSKGIPSVEVKPYNKVEAVKELMLHLKGGGPSSFHLHITEEMAKDMSGQEIAANYQQIVNGD